MDIDVSVILISYNKYPENLFTLYSLENQNYPKSRMEVVLIDDCSTDDTKSLKNYRAPFHFKYVSSPTKLGRAGAKNLGVKKASGKVLIFLDSEVIVDPDFITNHMRHYSGEEEVAVSGTSNHYSTFSVLYPDYSKRQQRLFHSLLVKETFFVEKVVKLLNIPKEKVINPKKFYRYVRKNKQKLSLLNKIAITKGLYKKLAFLQSNFSSVLRHYGDNLTGYHFCWTFFITRNVSVRKSSIEKVGLFNEVFAGWGYEDWELGYRLYKNGVQIIEDSDIYSYHQEHPYSKKNRTIDKFINYDKLVELHPEIEGAALILGISNKIPYIELNRVINEYYQMANDFPDRFFYSRETFNQVTRRVSKLLSQGQKLDNLFKEIDIIKLRAELEELRKITKYDAFVKALDLLLSM